MDLTSIYYFYYSIKNRAINLNNIKLSLNIILLQSSNFWIALYATTQSKFVCSPPGAAVAHWLEN